VSAGISLLDEYVKVPETARLGPTVKRTDVRSSIGPFNVLPEYKTEYPRVVIQALGQLYQEYNEAFEVLAEANREWGTDYQHCRMHDGTAVNFAIQIDMVGLPEGFLEAAAEMSVGEVREALRNRIFEIENSLAMYQLLERIFAPEEAHSFFQERFRLCLASLRERFNMPIALLAVTDEKYAAMRAAEFGKEVGDLLPSSEVLVLSGFDHIFGPAEFKRHIQERGGVSSYLLYARTSEPVTKLKHPGLAVPQPLLGDPAIRKIIKAYALTFNIDAPEMDPSRRINDTKAYAIPMGMGYPIQSMDDILPSEFAQYLASQKACADYDGARLSPGFAAYLESLGCDSTTMRSGAIALRGKPLQGTYGCYGHVRGELRDRSFRGDLRSNMRKRGSYIIQPEMPVPVIVNETNGQAYRYIDRNFLALTNGCPEWLGGFRSLMPVDSAEVRKGRIHGNGSTVWAEIR
jgi:hypothetical protein